jgi:hypothetical protein
MEQQIDVEREQKEIDRIARAFSFLKEKKERKECAETQHEPGMFGFCRKCGKDVL